MEFDIPSAVLACANGYCERCLDPTLFVKHGGSLYLEIHHIKPLGEGSFDHIRNTLARCPNCHRFLHSGRGRKTEWNSPLSRIQKSKILVQLSELKVSGRLISKHRRSENDNRFSFQDLIMPVHIHLGHMRLFSSFYST